MDQKLDRWYNYVQNNRKEVEFFCDGSSKLAATVLWIPLGYFGVWQMLMRMTFFEVESFLHFLNSYAIVLLGPDASKMINMLIPKSLFGRDYSIDPLSLFIVHTITSYHVERVIHLVMRVILALFCCIYRSVNGNRARRGNARTQERNGTRQNRAFSG